MLNIPRFSFFLFFRTISTGSQGGYSIYTSKGGDTNMLFWREQAWHCKTSPLRRAAEPYSSLKRGERRWQRCALVTELEQKRCIKACLDRLQQSTCCASRSWLSLGTKLWKKFLKAGSAAIESFSRTLMKGPRLQMEGVAWISVLSHMERCCFHLLEFLGTALS